MKRGDLRLSCQYVLSSCFFWHEKLLPFPDTVTMENQTKPEIPSPERQQVTTAFWKYDKVFLEVVNWLQT